MTGNIERLLLLTVFALSVRYEPNDVSLAVNSGLLPLLAKFCGPLLGQASHTLVYHTGQSQLEAVLEVASMRLVQIIAATTGYVYSAYMVPFYY